uniref:Uncharacterized protein n=1 Tax=Fagus sylvatica TaxID=28930 RepID=A0A2N9IWH9_FAGSY
MEMTGVLHLHINSCTTNQASSFWKVIEPWAPEPGLPLVELRIGKPAKAKMLIGIGTGLRPAKGAPMPLSPSRSHTLHFEEWKAIVSDLRELDIEYSFPSRTAGIGNPLDSWRTPVKGEDTVDELLFAGKYVIRDESQCRRDKLVMRRRSWGFGFLNS